MVKQAEKKVKKSPLVPIFGLIIGGGLGLVAFIIMDPLLKSFPEFESALYAMPNYWFARFLVWLGIWLPMLLIAYFLVAILAGRDPNSPKYLPMPPRNVKKKDWKK